MLYEAGMAVPLIAEVDGQPVSALILFMYAKKAYYFYGMSTGEQKDKMPNHFFNGRQSVTCKVQPVVWFMIFGERQMYSMRRFHVGSFRFKEGFNGTIISGIGAWDFILDHGLFKVYSEIMPAILNFMRKIGRKRVSDEVNRMNLPRVRLAVLPTPIEALQSLSAYLGGPQILVKRDDLTGLGMGGNKVRKLEFLIAEAQANGARMLITTGAAQSNHCRQTAAAAARMGYACHLVLTRNRKDSTGGNLLLDSLFGAEITWCEKSEREKVLAEVFDSAWNAGKSPFLIPYGGSNPSGASAYSIAFSELVSQGVSPDVIIFPTSSGGTQAGLVLGAKMHHSKIRVLGISVDEEAEALK